ncbi:hypothetical protein NW758_011196 [Fusarium oxysporum]|nr:hypothetical protein NW758_011196 [Fusarium oxysporum]
MIEILPFVALERILFYDGHEAVKRLLTIRPDYRKSLDFSSMHACMLMTYLVDFLNAQDPLKQKKDEKLELKALADEQRKLKAQIDAQAGPRSHSKHKNKKGSFTASSMFRGF